MDSLIYLVRHTEPALPDDRWRFIGRSDPPLSPQGIAHARELARRLRTVRFDLIHSSDLQRCLLTAQIIAEAGEGAAVGERRPGRDGAPYPSATRGCERSTPAFGKGSLGRRPPTAFPRNTRRGRETSSTIRSQAARASPSCASV